MSATPATQIPASLVALLGTQTLPGIGPNRRSGTKSASALNSELVEVLERSGLPSGLHDLVRGAVLLWHDHLNESHTISQGIHNPDGSFLHAIMHRREPDFANSKYWWHRVGSHPCFARLAARAGAFLDSRQPELKSQLLPDGQWDPFALVDACERASRHDGTLEQRQLLAELQRIEFEVFLEHVCCVQALEGQT